MSPAMGRMVTACCSIQASRTREREKFTVVPSSSWGSTVVGIGLVHSVGPPETVNLCLGGPYVLFGGPGQLVVLVGQPISCLGRVLLY